MREISFPGMGSPSKYSRSLEVDMSEAKEEIEEYSGLEKVELPINLRLFTECYRLSTLVYGKIGQGGPPNPMR